MINVRYKGKRQVQQLATVCVTQYCFKPPLKTSRYCSACRKDVRKLMENERLRFASRNVGYKFEPVDTNLYGIVAGKDAIKFGVAKNVKGRLSELQVGNHIKLSLIGSVACNQSLERLVHQYLELDWVTGEWHKFSPRSKIIVDALRIGNLMGIVQLVDAKFRDVQTRNTVGIATL